MIDGRLIVRLAGAKARSAIDFGLAIGVSTAIEPHGSWSDLRQGIAVEGRAHEVLEVVAEEPFSLHL